MGQDGVLVNRTPKQRDIINDCLGRRIPFRTRIETVFARRHARDNDLETPSFPGMRFFVGSFALLQLDLETYILLA